MRINLIKLTTNVHVLMGQLCITEVFLVFVCSNCSKPVALHTALYLRMFTALWMATDSFRSGSYSSDAGHERKPHSAQDSRRVFSR